MKITTDDIQNLIKFGRGARVDKDLLSLFKQRAYINRQDWRIWEKAVSGLSDLELISVYKGLIGIERELKWMGGSAAGAIWVYRAISQRGMDNNYSLANYGLQNCENPYIPFGGSYLGKRTISDYLLYQEEKPRIRAMKDLENNNRVKGRKKKRSTAIAELRRLSFKERGLILISLDEKYRSWSFQQRLELIAADEKYPPEYYPVEWIKVGKDEIEFLPVELIEKLYNKLSAKTKGDWRRFAQELQKIKVK